MANIRRFIWLRNRLPSVVGRRLCIGGNVADHEYCFKLVPTRLFIYPYHAQSTQDEHLVVGTQSSLVRDYQHVRSTPLLDLLSVSIHSSHNATSDNCKKDHRPFQVYGTIQLIDVEKDCASHVYCRRSSKPETVLPGYNLTLINSKGSYCSLHMPTAAAYKMRLNLKDANFDGRVIAKGDFDLQLFSDDDGYSDKIMTQVVPGLNGLYASVQYATLPHAVVATVKLKLTKIQETGSDLSEPSHACIYGRISATSKLQQGNAISRVLLDKPPCDPLMVNPGKRIKLQRHMLAVPAYSSLEIKADLWDHHTNQRIATDAVLANCEARDEYVINQNCVLGTNYHVQVQICWNNAYGVLDKERKQILGDERSYWSRTSRESQPSKDELLTSSPPIPSFIGSPMVEVFSITAFPDSDVNSSLCGTISVFDEYNFGGKGNPYCIFKIYASDPVSLSRDMKVKWIRWPNFPFVGECFGMHLHLSDDKGREVSRGYFNWDKLSATSPISWYGKLISSVIRGKHGYAIVNYAMFPNAADAKVDVKVILNESGLECMVVGNISAWYSSITHSSYIEKFWRSTLLGDDACSMAYSHVNALKLQKSVLAVPLNSSLILGLKFKVGAMGKTSENHWISKYIDSFDELVDFEVNVGKRYLKSIVGKGCKVEVLVEWNKLIGTRG